MAKAPRETDPGFEVKAMLPAAEATRKALLQIGQHFAQAQAEAGDLYDLAVNTDVVVLAKYLDENPPTALAVMLLILAAREQFSSRSQADRALKKAARYLPARDLVAREWAKAVGKQSKAEFARMMAPRVKREFGIDVTERTIANTWLAKGAR